MADLKEPHFFSEYRPPVEEVKHLDEYLGLFRYVAKDARVREVPTSYLYSATAAQNIDRFRTDAKIVAVLQDPASRAYSQYWNQVQESVEPPSFEEALAAEPERIEQDWWYGFHYVEGVRYAEQVEWDMELFCRDTVRVHPFEDPRRDTVGVRQDIFSFLLRATSDRSPWTRSTTPVARRGTYCSVGG